MRIEKAEVLVPADQLDPGVLERLERCARVCYRSEDKMGEPGDASFLERILRSGHESVIEHEKITVLFRTDRGVTHEFVRHRLGSYSQESTRYCRYDRERFGREIAVIRPFFLAEGTPAYGIWESACQAAEEAYFALLDAGRSAQEARSVLPHSLKTELVMTCNFRQWRHFFRLRCAPAAHPQARQVAIPLLLRMQAVFPVLFGEIPYDTAFPCEQMAPVVVTDGLFAAREEGTHG